ncbi:MAG: hypothetical protein WD425_16750 [Nitrospirales bacterium]
MNPKKEKNKAGLHDFNIRLPTKFFILDDLPFITFVSCFPSSHLFKAVIAGEKDRPILARKYKLTPSPHPQNPKLAVDQGHHRGKRMLARPETTELKFPPMLFVNS